MYVYQRTEPALWTVGYHKPDGSWEPESDHGSREEATRRVIVLNGGTPEQPIGYLTLSCAFDHIGEALDDYDDDKIGVAEFISRVREQVGEREANR